MIEDTNSCAALRFTSVYSKIANSDQSCKHVTWKDGGYLDHSNTLKVSFATLLAMKDIHLATSPSLFLFAPFCLVSSFIFVRFLNSCPPKSTKVNAPRTISILHYFFNICFDVGITIFVINTIQYTKSTTREYKNKKTKTKKLQS